MAPLIDRICGRERAVKSTTGHRSGPAWRAIWSMRPSRRWRRRTTSSATSSSARSRLRAAITESARAPVRGVRPAACPTLLLSVADLLADHPVGRASRSFPRSIQRAARPDDIALSASGAIYLILEMNRPFEGLMQISVCPLRKALGGLGPLTVRRYDYPVLYRDILDIHYLHRSNLMAHARDLESERSRARLSLSQTGQSLFAITAPSFSSIHSIVALAGSPSSRATSCLLLVWIIELNYVLHLHVHRPLTTSRADRIACGCGPGLGNGHNKANWRHPACLRPSRQGRDYSFKFRLDFAALLGARCALAYSFGNAWATYLAAAPPILAQGVRDNIQEPMDYRGAFIEQVCLILFVVALGFYRAVSRRLPVALVCHGLSP